MSEFIAVCPKCRQRILCDTHYIGHRVACPLCLQEIVMPSPSAAVPQNPGAPSPSASIPSDAAPAAPAPAAPAPAIKRTPLAMVIVALAVAIVAAGAGAYFYHARQSATPALAAAVPVASTTPAAKPAPAVRTKGSNPVARALARQGMVRIILVGDSTVADNSGWGGGFKQLLTKQAECINLANGNSSSVAFIQDGRWSNALAQHGDYYLIQFGFKNDPTNMAQFFDSVKQMVDDTRAIGATPVLVTPLVRRQFDKHNDHLINSSLLVFASEDERIAELRHVPLVDLHTRSKELCESLGRQGCYAFSPLKTVNGTNSYDGSHLTGSGNLMFAQLVVEELRKVTPELSPLLLSEPATQ